MLAVPGVEVRGSNLRQMVVCDGQLACQIDIPGKRTQEVLSRTARAAAGPISGTLTVPLFDEAGSATATGLGARRRLSRSGGERSGWGYRARPVLRRLPRGPRSSASTVEANQVFASTTLVLGTLASQRGQLPRAVAAAGENRSRQARQ